MELLDILSSAQEKFDKEIKPYINGKTDESNSFIAKMEMLNLIDYLSAHRTDISSYHHGPTLLAHSRIISDIYTSDQIPSEHRFREFMVSLAQTRLSVQTGNQ